MQGHSLRIFVSTLRLTHWYLYLLDDDYDGKAVVKKRGKRGRKVRDLALEGFIFRKSSIFIFCKFQHFSTIILLE